METWAPERKIVAGAIAGLAVGLAQQLAGFNLFPGGEAMFAIIVGYLMPNRS